MEDVLSLPVPFREFLLQEGGSLCRLGPGNLLGIHRLISNVSACNERMFASASGEASVPMVKLAPPAAGLGKEALYP